MIYVLTLKKQFAREFYDLSHALVHCGRHKQAEVWSNHTVDHKRPGEPWSHVHTEDSDLICDWNADEATNYGEIPVEEAFANWLADNARWI